MKKKGFTLIELLIVIAIIGLLATLGIISMTSARAKARDSKRISDLTQIRSAMELYYNDKGTYTFDDDEEGTCADGDLINVCGADNPYLNWDQFADPLASKLDADNQAPCTPSFAGATHCEYAWNGAIEVNFYEVCAMLEKEAEKFDFGEDVKLISITPDGFATGCTGTGGGEEEEEEEEEE